MAITSAEQAAWLRRILARNVADALRTAGSLKRDVARERSLEEKLDQSSARLGAWLALDQPSPASTRSSTSRRFCWPMHWHAFPSISARRSSCITGRDARWPKSAPLLDRTTSSVAGLLKRGLKQLRAELDARPEWSEA